jgi:hypothetical protein
MKTKQQTARAETPNNKNNKNVPSPFALLFFAVSKPFVSFAHQHLSRRRALSPLFSHFSLSSPSETRRQSAKKGLRAQ